MKCLLTSAHFDIYFFFFVFYFSFSFSTLIFINCHHWYNLKIYFIRSINSNRILFYSIEKPFHMLHEQTMLEIFHMSDYVAGNYINVTKYVYKKSSREKLDILQAIFISIENRFDHFINEFSFSPARTQVIEYNNLW